MPKDKDPAQKVSIAEYCQFLNEGWGKWAPGTKGDSWYMDDTSEELQAMEETHITYPQDIAVPHNGQVQVPLKTIEGSIYWQGDKDSPHAEVTLSLAKEFAKWRQAQTVAWVSFTVPKEALGKLLQLASELGAKEV